MVPNFFRLKIFVFLFLLSSQSAMAQFIYEGVFTIKKEIGLQGLSAISSCPRQASGISEEPVCEITVEDRVSVQKIAESSAFKISIRTFGENNNQCFYQGIGKKTRNAIVSRMQKKGRHCEVQVHFSPVGKVNVLSRGQLCSDFCGRGAELFVLGASENAVQ